MINGPALYQFSAVIDKWRDLAERRRLALVELQRNGRWKLYFTEAQFALRLAQASELAKAWANLAAFSPAAIAAAHISAKALDATVADYPT